MSHKIFEDAERAWEEERDVRRLKFVNGRMYDIAQKHMGALFRGAHAREAGQACAEEIERRARDLASRLEDADQAAGRPSSHACTQASFNDWIERHLRAEYDNLVALWSGPERTPNRPKFTAALDLGYGEARVNTHSRVAAYFGDHIRPTPQQSSSSLLETPTVPLSWPRRIWKTVVAFAKMVPTVIYVLAAIATIVTFYLTFR